ncbi:MAG: PadR family transcriptional regulator [Zestosphaera sp.]
MARRRRTQVLRHLILAVLATEVELHGYGIYKRIVYVTQSVWRPSIGTLYRTLNEMTREELVNKVVVSGRKVIYRITERGFETLVKETLPHATKSAGILSEFIEAYRMMHGRGDLTALPEEFKERLLRLHKALEEFLKEFKIT